MKPEVENILKAIKLNMEGLDDRDAEGHIWWNRFKDLVATLNLLTDMEVNEIFA